MDCNVPQVQKATHGGGNTFPRSPGNLLAPLASGLFAFLAPNPSPMERFL